MRRLYVRGRENVAKRAILHAAGFNLGLLMRVNYGMRKPRRGSGVVRALILAAMSGLPQLGAVLGIIPAIGRDLASIFEQSSVALAA
jgi:transposase